MISIEKKKLLTTSEKIAIDCKSWLQQFSLVAPRNVLMREKYMGGMGSLIRSLLGFFVKPKLTKKNRIYIFEGLRNKEYMSAFDPSVVFILGSKIERNYAVKHGYGFIWSFPIISAVNIKITRNVNPFIIKQLKVWVSVLSKLNSVTFFIYEDTQPLGCFIAHTGKLLQPITKTVCIQHGFYPKESYPIRKEGALSEINFLWSESQADVIGTNSLLTYEIGLPYFAIAKQGNAALNVILVGTGTANNGNDFYEKSLRTYKLIAEALSQTLDVKVFYRPHPNELTDQCVLQHLESKFPLIDYSDKLRLLNGSKAVFIGTVSSLLYEAGIAGHIVIHFKLQEELIPDFNFDFEFSENQLEELLRWFLLNIKYLSKSEKITINTPSPLDRFISACRKAKLMEANENS